MNKPQLCIGMSLAVTWLSGSAWRRTDSGANKVLDSDYFVKIAQLAESAHMDFVFRPDSLFVDPKSLSHSVGFCALDPTLLMACIAQHTSKIGLLTTISTTFNQPYIIARQLQSLHHISKGRAAWNIVTALDGYENFGLKEMPSSKIRYEKAKEFTHAVKELWQSFPAQAFTVNRDKGEFVDLSLINTPNIKGEYFDIKGPLSIPMSEAGPVPLFQAGASDIGRNFAAKYADGIFAACPDIEAAITYRTDVRARMRVYGRDPDQVKVLPGLSLYLADTETEAKTLFEQSQSALDLQRKDRFIASSLGIDLANIDETTVITSAMLNPMADNVRSHTHSKLLRRLVNRESLTLAALRKRPEVAASAHWQIIGTVEQAADEIISWAKNDAIDGFIALPGGSEQCVNLVCNQLIPLLAERGVFRTDYHHTHFKGHLNG